MSKLHLRNIVDDSVEKVLSNVNVRRDKTSLVATIFEMLPRSRGRIRGGINRCLHYILGKRPEDSILGEEVIHFPLFF